MNMHAERHKPGFQHSRGYVPQLTEFTHKSVERTEFALP
jgi:hypothetical protein